MYFARLARLRHTRIDVRSYCTAHGLSRSTSTFGRNEESFFKIQISNTNSFRDIVGEVAYSERDVQPKLRDLFLNDFDRDRI